jgi:hypothetical protein
VDNEKIILKLKSQIQRQSQKQSQRQMQMQMQKQRPRKGREQQMGSRQASTRIDECNNAFWMSRPSYKHRMPSTVFAVTAQAPSTMQDLKQFYVGE